MARTGFVEQRGSCIRSYFDGYFGVMGYAGSGGFSMEWGTSVAIGSGCREF